MIRNSSRFLNSNLVLKQIEENSIKCLINQRFNTTAATANTLNFEAMTANKVGCPFHQTNQESSSNESYKSLTKSSDNQSHNLVHKTSETTSFSLTSFNSVSTLKSFKKSNQSFDSIKFVDKIKMFFKNKFTKIDEQQLSDYLNIPNTSNILPGLTSIFRLTANGGVSYLHKHCDKLHKKHGGIYREQIGPVEGVFIADDELIKEVFEQEDTHPTHLIPEPWIIYNQIKKVQRGLFFLNGESWKKQRTCLNGLFLKKNALSKYMGFFTNVVDDVLYGFEKNLDDKNSLIIPELEKQLYSWSIESLGTVIFGRRLGCVPEMVKNPDCDQQANFDKHYKISKMQEDFNSAVRDIFIETGKMQLFPARLAYKWNLPVWQRFVEANDKALEIAKNYVDENIRENEELKKNSIKKDNEGKGIGILNELLKKSDLKGAHLNNIITDLFLAATDTTSHSTQWSLYLIAKNPECQQKILEELDNVLEEGEELEEKHLKHLDYVRGVIKETLRLYPVAPFISRLFSKDISVGKYKIPKNKMVVFSLYSIGRMEKHFKDADKFMPERWIRSEERKKVNSYAYIPFALGSRSCIGKKVAEAQMLFFISKLVRKFKIEMAKDEDIDIKLRMITTPEHPISLKLTKREV